MSRFLFFFCLFVFSTSVVQAQSGYWEGTFTQSGKSHSIKMYLKKEGRKTMFGTANIQMDSTLIELELHGVYHGDFSMQLWDVALENKATGEENPAIFKRRYQLLYKRKQEGESLKGYWQEAYNPKKIMHKQGLITLKRTKKPKA